MSEAQRAETNFQAAAEARKAESRANIANAIWNGIKFGVSVVTLKIYWGKFLEHGGSHEELMSHQPENFDEPTTEPPNP